MSFREKSAWISFLTYAAVFGQSFADKPVEIVAWKVEIHGPVPGGDSPYRLRSDSRSDTAALSGRRRQHRCSSAPETRARLPTQWPSPARWRQASSRPIARAAP